MMMIDETITASNETSRAVSGVALSPSSSRASQAAVALQIIPPSSGDWSVDVEAGISTQSGVTFTKIGEYDQDDESLLSLIKVSHGCMYRFKHTSGGSIRVILSGGGG